VTNFYCFGFVYKKKLIARAMREQIEPFLILRALNPSIIIEIVSETQVDSKSMPTGKEFVRNSDT